MGIAKLCKVTVGGLGAALLLTAGLVTTAFAAETVTTMATTAPLNLRDASSINGNVIEVMPQGTSVAVHGMTDDGWYHVTYQDKEGYCYYQFLNFEGSQDGTVRDGKTTTMYATDPLNVREQPNTNSRILGSLKIDEGVPVVAKHDGWFTVTFNGVDAYCYGAYLGFGQGGYKADPPSAGTTSTSTMNKLTTTAPLNVRTEPNTNGTIIGSFSAGTTVKVLAAEGDWYKVEFGNTTGYVYSLFLG